MTAAAQQNELAVATLSESLPAGHRRLPRYTLDDSPGRLFAALDTLKADLAVYLEKSGDDRKVRRDLISFLEMWEYPESGRKTLNLKKVSTKEIGEKLCGYLHDALIYCRQNGLTDTGIAVIIQKTANFLRSCAGPETGTPWPSGPGYRSLLASSHAFAELFDSVRENVKNWRDYMEENLHEMPPKDFVEGLREIGMWPSDAVVTLLSCLADSGPRRRELMLNAAAQLRAARDDLSESDRRLVAERISEILAEKEPGKQGELRRKLAEVIRDGARSEEYRQALGEPPSAPELPPAIRNLARLPGKHRNLARRELPTAAHS